MRRGACACGAVTLTCEGEPLRRSLCHCLQCQQRTGSAFSIHAYWPTASVMVTGAVKRFSRSADSGRLIHFHFCPDCGSTMFWKGQLFPDRTGVPVGLLGDPGFPPPEAAIFAEHQFHWVTVPEGTPEFPAAAPLPPA